MGRVFKDWGGRRNGKVGGGPLAFLVELLFSVWFYFGMDRLKVRVVMDDREKAPELERVLRGAEDFELGRERLRVGDYVVGDRYCFERKRVEDFLNSVVDGRLFRQAEALRNGDLRPVLIVEGGMETIDRHGMSRESLQGALIALTLGFDLPLIRTFDEIETGKVLLYAGRQLWRRQTERTFQWGGRNRRGRRGKQLQILQSFPGVGPDRALSLLDAFGSLKNLANADVKVLCTVKGVGEGTARKIWKVMR